MRNQSGGLVRYRRENKLAFATSYKTVADYSTFDIRNEGFAIFAWRKPTDIVRAEVVKKRFSIVAGERDTRPPYQLHDTTAPCQSIVFFYVK
jgi:hypothetical protein